MKSVYRVMALLAMVVGTTSLASASPFTFFVNPTQTFGTPSNLTTPTGVTAPTVYSLATLSSDLGFSLFAGSTISFAAVGQVCYNPGVQLCNSSSSLNEKSVSLITAWPVIEGFFVGSSSAPVGSTTSNLSPGGMNEWLANITGMFDITALGTGPIIIPTGTTGVEFAFVDSYYADNSDASGTLGVLASASPIPEPATYGMMIAGLGALLTFKRARRS